MHKKGENALLKTTLKFGKPSEKAFDRVWHDAILISFLWTFRSIVISFALRFLLIVCRGE